MNNSVKFIVTFFLIMAISACKKENKLNTIISNQPQSQPQISVSGLLSAPADAPGIVWQAASQPDPNKTAPVIFYTPHQDDETLGMGASIAEHVRLGKPVYVVLLTNGENTEMLKHLRLDLKMPNATMNDVINARTEEFKTACKALGVHRIYIANKWMGYPEINVPPATLKEQFKRTMRCMQQMFPSPKTAHKTVSGNLDSYNRYSPCYKHPSHQAAASALQELYSEKINDVRTISDARLYRVYVYYWNYGTCDKSASWFKPVASADRLKRQNAMEAYKRPKIPTANRYGLGYFSVPELFNNSYNSNYEYVDFMPND